MDDTCAVRVAAAVLRDDADGMDAGWGCLEAVHLDACWVKLCVSLQVSRAFEVICGAVAWHAVYPAI
ncbi:hypothetical protein VDS41_15105 [Xanthomonas campestris pv. campestris]|nr:hypothetical protein [Xanthomonas campestris pv. campestris]